MTVVDIGRNVVLASICAAAAGCDKIEDCLPTGYERRTLERTVKETSRAESEAPDEMSGNSAIQAFRNHVKSATDMLSSELAAAKSRLDEAKADSEGLAAAISAAYGRRSEDGAAATRVEALLSLMRDEAVNVLSRKYMRRSFSVDSAEAEEKIGAARDSERRTADEIRANAAAARATAASADAESRRAKAAALEAEKKIKREIDDLRLRERRLKTELNMVATDMRRVKERELRDVSDDIRRLNREYDAIRSASAVNKEVQRADDSVRRAKQEADRRRSIANSQFRDAGAGSSASDIVAEFEGKTVKALEGAILEAADAARARSEKISRALAYVKSAGGVHDPISASALRGVRNDIDACVKSVLSGD